MRNFAILGKINDTEITGAVLKKLTFDFPITKKHLESTYKMLIVRNPWERLLSAYRDKLETSKTPEQVAFQVIKSRKKSET